MANFRDLTVRLYIEADTEKGVLKSVAAFKSIAREADQTQKHLDRAGSNAGKTDGVFSKMAHSLGSFSSGLASASVGIASFGAKLGVGITAIGALGGAAAAATAPTLGLVAALAPAVGIVAALPGALGMFAVASNVFKVATAGMDKVFDAALSQNAMAFGFALEGLGPKMRAVAHEIYSLGPAIDAARKYIQGNFWGDLEGVATRLNGAFLKVLPELGDVAEVMASIVKAVADFVTTMPAIRMFESIINNTRITLGQFKDAIVAVIEGFLNLSRVGSSFIASLSPGVADLTQKFGNWLTEISRSGQALDWMFAALDVLKMFGSLILNLVQLFGGLIRAMQDAGLGTLGILGQLVGAMNEWVNSAQGQKVLIDIFKALNRIGGAFIPVILGIVQAVASIAPVIGQLAQMAAPILINVLNAIEGALQGLAPGVKAFVSAFGDGIETLVPAVIELGISFGKILVAVSPLIPVVAGLAAFLGQVLANEITRLMPTFAMLIDGMRDAIHIIAPLGGAILRLASEALATLFRVIGPLLPVIAELVTVIGMALVKALLDVLVALKPVMPVLVEAIRLFGLELAGSLKIIMPLLNEIIVQWVRLLPPILLLIPPLLQIAMDIMPIMVNMFQAFLPHSAEFARMCAEIFTLLIPLIPKFFELTEAFIPLSLEMSKIALAVARELLPAIERMLPVIIPIIEKIVDWFTWLFDKLVGHSIIPDLMGLIKSWWEWGVAQVQRVIQWFGTIPATIGKWLADMFGEVVKWLNRTVEFFAGLPNSIIRVLSGLGATLYDSGRRILQGLIDGLWSMFDSVMSTVGDILGRIREAFPFSPAKWGPFSGHGYTTFSGQALMRDFAKGIRSQAGIVDTALEDAMSHSFTPEMPSVSAQWSANVSGGMAGGGVVIQSLNLHFADDRDMYTKGKEFADGLREYRRRGGVLPT